MLHLITLSDTHSLGRTPQDKGSARRWGLYLTTDNIHERKTRTPSTLFEPAISTSERHRPTP